MSLFQMMKELCPLHMIDGYKTDHRRQYPDETSLVYANFTPRKSRMLGVNDVVFFGLQYFLKEYLGVRFQRDFFDRPRHEVVDEYALEMNDYLGPGAVPVDHIEALHKLGHLPLLIKAVPEGTRVPIRVPMLTIRNTDCDFFWLTNQLETILSCSLWLGCTSATTAFEYRRVFNAYAKTTGVPHEFTRFQGHDFSFRGMPGLEAARISGAAHLTSFVGTDTVPALSFVRRYYGGPDNGLIGCSVPATEHSVMCMGTQEGEIETYRRLIREVYPNGIVSIVSDTWDFWAIVTEGVKALKGDILARNGKVVIRPDSGDPVKIICGDPMAESGTPEFKGAVECLWEVFGGSITPMGFKHLDSHIGIIYGDSITLERQQQILDGLSRKGFCSDVVLGIGSYTYQYVTRDTFGFAMKATYGEVNGVGREIFKSPKTDKGSEKKSAKGLIQVCQTEEGDITMQDGCSWDLENKGLLRTVFDNGRLFHQQSFADVRRQLHGDQF